GLVWYVLPGDWPLAAVIAGACGVCLNVLSPIAVEFWRVHARFGLSRSLNEIVLYSADATSLLTGSRLLALWGWTARFNGNEARIFPGSTIMVLAALGAVAAITHHRAARRLPLASITLLVVGCLFGAVAAVT